MSTKQLLITDRRAVREVFGKSDKDAEKDIEIIREWLKTQAHLPEIPNDNFIEAFLAMNKFSIERTKPKLDMYYTIPSLIPEIYDHCNPLLPHMKHVTDTMGIFIPLAKPTKGLQRVCLLKFLEDAEAFDAYKYFAYTLIISEMKLQYDIATGDVYILDYQNLKMGHVMKMSPVHMKKASIILEKVFSNRVKSIHIINHPPFVDILMTVLKGVMKPKLVDRIKLHQKVDELYEYVSKEALPADYGGDELSVKELTDLWTKYLAENADRFEKLSQMKVNEDLRPTPLENDEILGYHGNFKKLDVD